jgi:hypothetical protein
MRAGNDQSGVDADETRWFDVKRLERMSDEPVMQAPDFSLPEIGAANKPVR